MVFSFSYYNEMIFNSFEYSGISSSLDENCKFRGYEDIERKWDYSNWKWLWAIFRWLCSNQWLRWITFGLILIAI